METWLLGVFYALLSCVLNNTGLVVQKVSLLHEFDERPKSQHRPCWEQPLYAITSAGHRAPEVKMLCLQLVGWLHRLLAEPGAIVSVAQSRCCFLAAVGGGTFYERRCRTFSH